jgi:hypothetical protein
VTESSGQRSRGASEGEAKRAKGLGGFRPAKDLRNIQPPAYNIEGLLQQGTTANLWGLPGETKTTHATDWWARLSLGLPWRDKPVSRGIAAYLPLEDMSGFRARVEAWQEHNIKSLLEHNVTSLPDHALWWDDVFDFSEECIAKVRRALQAAETKYGLPVVLIVIDPIMAAFGEGSVSDENEFRKRLKAIESLRAPFSLATALVVQHAGWDGKHELGSILQRALTATSIKAASNGDVATLTIVRQKNDEEGKTLHFRKVSLGSAGKLVVVPEETGASGRGLTGQKKDAWDALVKAVDTAEMTGQSLPKKSENLSARCPVHLWKAEFARFLSDGADTGADTIARAFRRAKSELKALGIIALYDNYAAFVLSGADKADIGVDN